MQKKLKIYFVFLLYLSLSFIAASAPAGEKKPSEIKIATVNGSIITQEDFNWDMNKIQQIFLGAGKQLDDSQLSALKSKILDELINRELLYQDSQKKGITVDDAQINEQLEKLKKGFPSEADFKASLIDADISEAALKSRITRGIILEKFIDTHFSQKTTISDNESNTFYKENPNFFIKPEQVRASHILIQFDPKDDESKKKKALKKLEKIKQKLEKGGDFSVLAKESSQDPSSAEGGDLGYFSRGQMVKPFEDAAFALEIGKVSNIVMTDFGYHLIKVTDKKPETVIPYQEVKTSLENYLKQKKVQEEVNAYINKLKEKAKIEKFLPEG